MCSSFPTNYTEKSVMQKRMGKTEHREPEMVGHKLVTLKFHSLQQILNCCIKMYRILFQILIHPDSIKFTKMKELFYNNVTVLFVYESYNKNTLQINKETKNKLRGP
jgi:hypothetical protein